MAFTFRKQQIFYGVALLLAVLASAACGLIGRFHDIDFSQDLNGQYIKLTNGAPPLLETNIALAAFLALLILVDGLRSPAKGAIPVWFELVWTFVFGVIEIIDIVLVANNYPSLHCSPSSVSSLTKRDTIGDDVIGQAATASPDQNLARASKEICQNWAVMLVFFVMIAVLLFAQWFSLALLGLRHRVSHPDFFIMAETPAPFTWHLSASSATAQSSDSSSIASSSFSTEKAREMDVVLGMPVPIQVRVQKTQVDRTVC
ncbi:hypothetical protein FRC04_008667 [Tulasnella sp. 424]|nr:hypothetical protein FRC04_008667 [Tulasnella sp. 424]KAG8979900.1 hypothetical protein FRC05_007343 [Tulasnella sp. 425]